MTTSLADLLRPYRVTSVPVPPAEKRLAAVRKAECARREAVRPLAA